MDQYKFRLMHHYQFHRVQVISIQLQNRNIQNIHIHMQWGSYSTSQNN